MRRPPPAASGSPAPEPRPALRKSLGQHHLRSGATCRPLIEFLRPTSRRVVEIGPGGGVLTAELLAAGARVLALELDPAWARELSERLDSPNLEVRTADALEFDWASVPAGTLVAGNLPYNVGTAIVERVLRASGVVERAAFLLQREVVDRLVAGAGAADYGALSVLVKLRAEATVLGRVRRGSFVPPPRVDSAFVGLTLRPLPPALTGVAIEEVESWIREAFSKRRKTLANSLAGRHRRADVAAALAAIDRPENCRAEALPLTDLLRLFMDLAPAGHDAREAAPATVERVTGGTISSRGIERKP